MLAALTTTALAGALLASNAGRAAPSPAKDQGPVAVPPGKVPVASPADPVGPVRVPVGPVRPVTIPPITHLPGVDCKKLHDNWGQVQPQKLVVQVPDAMGNCPIAGCGLNGSWLGSGVRFRTLHVTAGALNPQNLRVRDFTQDGRVLRLEVVGQQLKGIKRDASDVIEGRALIGAKLALEHVDAAGRVDMTYTLKIADVKDEDFWTTCRAGADCRDAIPKVRLYTFTVSASDGCEVQLCRPGLSDKYQGGVNGTAVIFRGDYYEEGTHAVRTSPVNDYDQDVFNIACVGTAISKLHLLRHTTAADPTRPTAPGQRQALLRLLDADYCGTGGSFTDDGVPMWLGFDSPRWEPSGESRYPMGPGGVVEAQWNERGASCLNAPRLTSTDRARIDEACRLAGRAAPIACPAPDPAHPVMRGNSAISWNRPR